MELFEQEKKTRNVRNYQNNSIVSHHQKKKITVNLYKHLTDERSILIDVFADRRTNLLVGLFCGVAYFRLTIGDTLGGDKTPFALHGVNDRRIRFRGNENDGDKKFVGVLVMTFVPIFAPIGLSGINGEFGV